MLSEAIEIIEKEMVEKTGILNISGCSIYSIAEEIPEIQKMDWLKELNLFNNNLVKIECLPTNIKKLNLSFNNITKLENIPKHLKELFIAQNKIKVLENLPQSIESFYIARNNVEIIENLPLNLVWINIDDNEIKKIENLPSSISNLSLSGNKIQVLENLPKKLNKLTISYNNIKKLENLPATLKKLFIDNNDIEKLENLPNVLSWLFLQNNKISKIEKLPNYLSILNLNENGIKKIENFPEQLDNLYLSNNSIKQIENLPQNLKTLSLINNSISKIENLVSGLESLFLDETFVSTIENLPLSLKKLFISKTNVTKLENLHEGLEVLFADNNKIERIENLPSSIQRLGLANNNIKSLEALKPFIKDNFKVDFEGTRVPDIGVNITNNQLEHPPLEIVEEGNQAILNYFEELEKQGETYLYEAKLLLIGEGNVGKTSLALKLLDKNAELPKKADTTKGVDIRQMSFETEEGNQFKINIWDFGGQEIYKATHQFFLTHRSLYLLVDDTRRNDTSIEDPKLYEWLETAKLFGAGSPLMMVQNEVADRSKKIDIGGYRKAFDFIKEYHHFNFENCDGIEELHTDIRHHIQKLVHVGQALPTKWLAIREELIELSKTRPYISQKEYFDIYTKHLEFNKKKALEWSKHLHNLGTLLHFQEDDVLKKTIILENEWATDAVYGVLDNEPIKQANGHFSKAVLKNIWSDAKYEDMVAELLALMVKFELCYKIPDKKDQYLIPQLLPIQEPEHLDWNYENNLQLIYRYEYMPKGILSSIIVRMHAKINDLEKAWAKGVVLEHNNTQALIKHNNAQKEISIRIHGVYQKDFMTIIIEEIDKINSKFKGIEVSKEVPCTCDTCKKIETPHFYEHDKLLEYIGNGRFDVRCDNKPYEEVDILDLLDNLFKDFRKKIEEIQKHSKEIGSIGKIIDLTGNGNNIFIDTKLEGTSISGGSHTKQEIIEKQEKTINENVGVIAGGDVKGTNVAVGKDIKQEVSKTKTGVVGVKEPEPKLYEQWWFISIGAGILAFILSLWLIPKDLDLPEWLSPIMLSVLVGVVTACVVLYLNPRRWLRKIIIALSSVLIMSFYLNINIFLNLEEGVNKFNFSITEPHNAVSIGLMVLIGVLVYLEMSQNKTS